MTFVTVGVKIVSRNAVDTMVFLEAVKTRWKAGEAYGGVLLVIVLRALVDA